MKVLKFTKNNGKYRIVNDPARIARFEADYKTASAPIRKPPFPRTDCRAITKGQAVAFIKHSIEAREFDSVLSAADLAGVELFFIPNRALDGYSIVVDPQPFTIDNCPAELVIGECYVGNGWCWEVVVKKYGVLALSSMAKESKAAFMKRAKKLAYTAGQWQTAIDKIENGYKSQAEMRKEFEAFAYEI